MNLKNMLLLILLFWGVSLTVNAQYCPPNIDFETGSTAGWQYYKGTVSTGPVYSLTSCAPTIGYHTLTAGTDTDYYGGFPVVCPGGSFSLKLGDNVAGVRSQQARYYVHVPTGSSVYSLLYHYAVVLENPAHSLADQPSMQMKVYDSATGSLISCDSFLFVASSTLYGFSLSSIGTDVYYRPWTSGNINLKGLGGSTVIVEFTTAGCTPGGHFGYGYIDMGCGVFATMTIACGTPTETLSGPAGYAHYRWCDSATMGTTIDTTQNITIPTPGYPTKYAVILTPYPGYGCPDTLYTVVVPITPCSGAPVPGGAYSTRSAVCGAPDTLIVTGYSTSCGLTFQWQSSPDNSTWTDIAGATIASCPYYNPYISLYYRCQATCAVSGLFAYSSSVFVPAIAGVGMTSVSVPPSTVCNGAHFYVCACGASTAFNVTSFYGDGTTDNYPLSTTGIRHVDIQHNYPFPGTYSIKQVLFDGILPVDSVSFSYNYLYCSTLPVDFYFDANNNCTKDPGETNLQPLQIEVDSNGITLDTISATSGFYYLAYGPPGTVYAFKVLTKTPWYSIACPPSAILYDTIISLANYYSEKSFGMQCTTAGFDVGLYIVNRLTRGFHQITNIYAYNNLCTPVDADVTEIFSQKYINAGKAKPVPSSVSGNSATWHLSSLGSGAVIQIYNQIENNPTTGPLTKGDTVYSSYLISPTTGDYDTLNNCQNRLDTVSSSVDPNFILVTPPGCIPSGLDANRLQYTINFENVGNDTAFNIAVMDTLPANIAPRSLEIVFASAQMDIAHFNVAGLNIVKFDFPAINLLDSSHHGQCDGIVVFNVNTIPGLPDGTTIDNRAGIYFDINPVVMTNTAENVIGCPALGVPVTKTNHKLQLFPNPATNELTITSDDKITGVAINNLVGQTVYEHECNTNKMQVAISTLPAGVYFVKINGTEVRKFVKL